MNSRKRRVGAIVKSFSEDVQRSFSRDGLNILLVRMAKWNSSCKGPEVGVSLEKNKDNHYRVVVAAVKR